MDRFKLQAIKAKSIETVAERLGIRVSRHKAICPFHDDHHASLTFNPRHNICRCFVCMDRSMTLIDLVMATRGLNFVEACRWLTEMDGGVWDDSDSGAVKTRRGGESASPKPEPVFDSKRYERFFINPWLNDEARRFLFTDRRLDPRVVRWCRLTSWTDKHGVPWLCTPYFDQQGRLIGVQHRNLAWKPEAQENGGGSGAPSKGTVLSNGAEPGGGSPSPERKPTADGNGRPNGLSDGGKPSKGKFPSDESGRPNRLSDGGEPSKGTSPGDGSGNPDGGSRAPNGTPKVRSPAVEAPRFRFPRGARCTIYGLQIVPRLRDGDELYITEGCSDCWAMLSSGHKAIAIPSATLLSEDDARLLTNLSESLHLSWHMYPDRDLPGERLFLQLREILPTLVHHQLPPGCKDYSEKFLTER